MKTYSPVFLLAALGVLTGAGTAAASPVDTSAWTCKRCPYPEGTNAVVEAGLGAVSDDSAAFGDFTGLQKKGAYLVLGGSLSHRAPGGLWLDAQARDLGLDVREFGARGGQEGRYVLRLNYAELVRHYGDGARSPFLGSGSSVLTLPAGFPAGTTAAMPLGTTLQAVSPELSVQRFELGGSWIGTDRLSVSVNLRRDVRDGSRPGYVSYFATAAQAALPVDHVTDQVELMARYDGGRWSASVGYQLSQFDNGLDAIVAANPFTPVAGDTRARLSTAPDNQFHQLVASGAFQVSPTIRASADVAAGQMTQDQAYIAATINPTLTVPALPQASLDGRVDTFNGSVRVSATPMAGLRLVASYARDVRENRTRRAAYPNVATDLFLDPVQRTNVAFSHWQDRFKLGADWRGGPLGLRLAGGVEQDNRERSYAEVVETRETSAWARASLQPIDTLSVSLKLSGADRTHSTYGTATWFGAPENPLLRKYNLADRRRQAASLRADFAASDSVSIGLTADVADDDYRRSIVGLRSARTDSIGADLAVTLSERTRVSAFAQAERVRSEQAGSQVVGAPDWTARTRDRFETVGLSLTHAVIPDKLDVGADLSRSRSSSAISVQTGVGEPDFPSATTALDRLKIHASYKLNDRTTLIGSLWVEEADAKDWRLDGVLPATVANLLSFGQQATNYRVGVFSVSVRHRF